MCRLARMRMQTKRGFPTGRSSEEAYPVSSPAEIREPTPVELATGSAPSPSPTAQEYKGFRNCPNLKRSPGYGSRSDCPDGRKKKPQQKTAETWITQEFYQVPAASADAKAFIDKMGVPQNRQWRPSFGRNAARNGSANARMNKASNASLIALGSRAHRPWAPHRLAAMQTPGSSP